MPKLIRTRNSRVLVLLFALIALFAAGCSSDSGGNAPATVTKTASGGASSSDPATKSTSASPTKAPDKPVHIKTLNSDGATYGVGMPVIAYFNKKPTDGRPLQEATKVTANGKPLAAAWYFEYSSANKGYPVEAHLRPKNYWPADSKIHIDIPAKGVSAGKGLAFDNSLTLDFTIGASHIVTVDNASHKLTVTVNGKTTGTYPVSLGASNTRTQRGIKVIMEKGRDISMRGPGYFEPSVKDTQRLTYAGEYLHSAPWNISNINNGVNSSNGCTNLKPADADTLYGQLRVGDVVSYPNADGPKMQLGQGYGDWNLTWGEWQTGGLVSTT